MGVGRSSTRKDRDGIGEPSNGPFPSYDPWIVRGCRAGWGVYDLERANGGSLIKRVGPDEVIIPPGKRVMLADIVHQVERTASLQWWWRIGRPEKGV